MVSSCLSSKPLGTRALYLHHKSWVLTSETKGWIRSHPETQSEIRLTLTACLAYICTSPCCCLCVRRDKSKQSKHWKAVSPASAVFTSAISNETPRTLPISTKISNMLKRRCTSNYRLASAHWQISPCSSSSSKRVRCLFTCTIIIAPLSCLIALEMS